MKSSSKVGCFHVNLVPLKIKEPKLVGGIPIPVKNDGVRQLGWMELPNWMESHEKFHGSSHHQPESLWIQSWHCSHWPFSGDSRSDVFSIFLPQLLASWHPGILAPRSSCWTQCHCRWPLSTETTGSYSSTGWKGMASGNLSKSKKPGKKSAKKMQPVG